MDDQTVTGLPASIEAAWGLRARPNRGPRPALSLERIVAAAVRVAATDGLQAVSMSRVAADLGVSTMSLYRYVGCQGRAARPDGRPDLRGPGPQGPGGELARRPGPLGLDRAGGVPAQPWVLRIPISGPPVTPNAMAWLEVGLDCLRDTGLREDEKLSVMLLLTGFVRSQASLQAEVAAAQAAGAAPPDPELMGSYGRLLARLADPGGSRPCTR